MYLRAPALLVVAACSAGLLIAEGCEGVVGIDERHLARSDASVGADASTADAAVDAGPTPTDAGPTRTDAGLPPTDGGLPPTCHATPLGITFAEVVNRVTVAMSQHIAEAGAMTMPSDADRDVFAAQVLVALTFNSTEMCPLPPSYRVFALEDQGDDILVVAELDAIGNAAPRVFYGTYAARRHRARVTRDLVVQAPHPLADTNTEDEAAALFSSARAEIFMMAGTHRCASSKTSGCDGTTDVCSAGTAAPFRETDAAHSTKNPFWGVHAALSQARPSPFVQVHTNDASCPDALLSDGSGTFSDAGPTANLAAALEQAGTVVGRCGAGYPTTTCKLCAIDNVEARFTAGASEAAACTKMGTTYGRLVHIEQKPRLRANPMPLFNAIKAAFPPSP